MKNQSGTHKKRQRPIRILEAAGRLIIQYGYDKTTMEDIAREAGVSKGAIYLEWSGREELFDALFEFEMKKLVLDLKQRVATEPTHLSVSSLYAHTLKSLNANRLIAALYTRDGKILGDFVHRQDPNRYVRRLLLSQESILALQKSGLLRSEIRADVLAYIFSVIALGLLNISSIIPVENAPPLEMTIDAISTLVETGLVLPGEGNTMLKETTLRLLDLMMTQYTKEEQE